MSLKQLVCSECEAQQRAFSSCIMRRDSSIHSHSLHYENASLSVMGCCGAL